MISRKKGNVGNFINNGLFTLEAENMTETGRFSITDSEKNFSLEQASRTEKPVVKNNPGGVSQTLNKGRVADGSLINLPKLSEKIGGEAVSNCMFCGRRLTDPESVKRGIGPVCWRRIKTLHEQYLRGELPEGSRAFYYHRFVMRDLMRNGVKLERAKEEP